MAERDPDCLFCKIVAGELPATIVAEDERTVSFMDINPATRGHALVVPREHAVDVLAIGERTSPRAPPRRGVAARRDALGASANLLNPAARPADGLPLPARDPALSRDPLRLPWVPGPGDADEIAAAGAALRA